MELVDYLRVLRRRWALVALAVLVCTGAAVAFSLRQTPVYEASVRLVVSDTGAAATTQAVVQHSLAVQRAVTYAQFASTPPVVDWALAGAGEAADAGRPVVTATAEAGSPFLTIAVDDPDPRRAAAVANAYAGVLPAAVARLEGAAAASRFSLVALAPAGVPSKPIRPKPIRNGGLGLALGLVLGVGCAFLTESLDHTYKRAEQLEQDTGLPVLGVIPQELKGVPLPAKTHSASHRAEAYRTIRTNVQFAGPAHTLKTILITSASPGEGKTSLATNLAVAFAATGQSVVLVDADLRRRRVGEAFGLMREGVGLAGVLAGWSRVAEAVHAIEPDRLAVLPAGSVPKIPTELLGGPRMMDLLKELGDSYEVVLVDSPPALPVADPLILAVNATGVVVVVRFGETSRERLRRTIGNLQKLGVPLLGLVANGAVAAHDPAYGYGYVYGSYGERQVARKGSRRKRGRWRRLGRPARSGTES